MGMMIKAGGSEQTFTLAPSGAFAARCFRVIDLGTQSFPIKGVTKELHQVLLGWELSENMEDGKPFIIHEKYTQSIYDKAKLCSVLESWRGRKFTEAERNGFDIEQIVGKVCFLNIVHLQKGEKTYATVATVMPVPKGLNSPPAVNEQQFFNIKEWNDAVFEKIPKYYREMIMRSPEYAAREYEAHSEGLSHEETWGQNDEDSEMPF